MRFAWRCGQACRKIGARQPLPYKNDPNARRDWEYYEQAIQPLLKEPGVEMIGEVGGAEKLTLLREAAALLFPIQWPEPFGLVMIEALACGTPVVALRQGSVPEVIDNGLTGWIVDTEDELVAAVDRLGELAVRAGRAAGLDRRVCASAILRLVWEHALFIDLHAGPIGLRSIVSRRL